MADARNKDEARTGPENVQKDSTGKSEEGRNKVQAKEQAESATAETKENREANAAPELPEDAVTPEPVLDELHNRRPGPEENRANKAFADSGTGMEPAPLAKTKADTRRQATAPRLALDYRDRHAALQEDQQWLLNREQAKVTSSETPAGDSSPAPEGNDSANWVDTPGRAHTLSEPNDYNTPDSVGKRLARVVEAAQLEKRSVDYEAVPGAYTVEEELRMQWPGISLGDDVKED